MKSNFKYLIIILILPLSLIASALCIPSQYEKSYMGELKYKYERLRETQGPRIIIVGGSGMAFDVDSALFKENFPEYEIVNMGMYAALGSSAVLNLTLPQLHEGDIVIFAPEQNPQTLSCFLGADYAWQALDGALYMLPAFLNSEDNIALMLSSFPRFATDKFKMFVTETAPDPTSIYRLSAFNEYGDIADVLSENVMTDGYDINTDIAYNEYVIEDDFIDYLNDYNKKVSGCGAKFLFAYCPANELAVGDLADSTLKDYASYLKSRFDFDILGDPHNAVMDFEWFYDTNYHLNSSGKIFYTRQLIRDLKAYLGDASLTDISVPDKPRYNLSDYDNNIQSTMTADTYSGNNEIDTVIIPEYITVIEDYAFDGCSNLKEIHIENAVPSDIQIGQHLLDGTSANIYVPAKSLSLYKTDYRFSLYSDRLFPEEN